MTTFPVYIDLPEFLNTSVTNIETNTLVGGNTTLSSATLVGVTSLPVVSITGFTNGQSVWLLDGLNAEIVTITAAPSGSTLTTTATASAHGSGVSVASAGMAGSLAGAIQAASREAENICQQFSDGATEYDTAADSLYAIARTELYETPYGNAQITVDGALVIQPNHFPVRSVSSVTIQFSSVAPTAVNLAGLVLPNGGRQITIPAAQAVNFPPHAPGYLRGAYPRDAAGYVSVTYTGGPIVGATIASVPSDIKAACALLTMDRLAVRSNPQGAAMTNRGDVRTMWELRGDFGGKSMLWKDAQQRLRRFIRRT